MNLDKDQIIDILFKEQDTSNLLFKTMNEISIEDLKSNIEIKNTFEWIKFNIYNHNIWFITLLENNSKLFWVDTINVKKNKINFKIEWLLYFMIKYVIWLCDNDNFKIMTISIDLMWYWSKIADNLKKDNIIIDYKFIWYWWYKDLILDLK